MRPRTTTRSSSSRPRIRPRSPESRHDSIDAGDLESYWFVSPWRPCTLQRYRGADTSRYSSSAEAWLDALVASAQCGYVTYTTSAASSARYARAVPSREARSRAQRAIHDLVEEGFDLAVRITASPAEGLIARRLASSSVVICGSPEYVRLHGRPTQPGDLARHSCLGYKYQARE
jgi:hypothetical protein